uniref:Uncharacterized protein n=1 Tax=Oncorhynchus tshawytscha TaxID=74940 RepID=A0AAZ3RT84_ONCTS
MFYRLKKRTRKAFGLRKKEKDTDSTRYVQHSILLNECSPAPKGKQHFSSSDTEDEDDNRKFKIKIKPLPSDTAKCAIPSMDELKASVGGLALSPSLVSPCCSNCM